MLAFIILLLPETPLKSSRAPLAYKTTRVCFSPPKTTPRIYFRPTLSESGAAVTASGQIEVPNTVDSPETPEIESSVQKTKSLKERLEELSNISSLKRSGLFFLVVFGKDVEKRVSVIYGWCTKGAIGEKNISVVICFAFSACDIQRSEDAWDLRLDFWPKAWPGWQD